jgi:hypothetical protein
MFAPTTLKILADAGAAASLMRAYVTPVVQGLGGFASLVCVVFLIIGGFHYMTSAGHPEKLEQAKRVIRNALIGLVIVLSAVTLTSILVHAYSRPSTPPLASSFPALSAIQPASTSSNLVDVLINAITGLLNSIIQSAGAPFMKALSYFTSSTTLMASNASVLNLWVAVVGMADVIFVLVVALIGFHVMSCASFGMDEIEIKHLLPQLALVFLLMNSSMFVIDGLISFSNAMIHALQAGPQSVWGVLTSVVQQASSVGIAALIIMLAFLAFAVILLVYYVGRIVTLYIGAVLSPLVVLLWLVPGFRDFAVNAAKTYVATIFVLFVHVVILALAASLLGGMAVDGTTHTPDALMAMVIGLATLMALLKTQGIMMQLSYASIGPRTIRKLSGQLVTGVSYLTGRQLGAGSVAPATSQSQGQPTSAHKPVLASSNLIASGQNQQTVGAKSTTALKSQKPAHSIIKTTPKPATTATLKLPTKVLPMKAAVAGEA